MKEIGSELESAREAMGVSLDEAASDLKLKPSQLENIENGNRSAFKDVFELKQIIKDYAKYLGLEYEKLEDEFNEFVFEYTSKIPLDEIAKANEEKKSERREIMSPYTIEYDRSFSYIKLFLMILLVIVIGVVIFLVVINFNNNDDTEDSNMPITLRESGTR